MRTQNDSDMIDSDSGGLTKLISNSSEGEIRDTSLEMLMMVMVTDEGDKDMQGW